MRPGRVALRALVALAVPSLAAAGGDRFVLAWPPTRYASAEIVAWRDVAGAETLRIRVAGRGIDRVVDVPASEAARVPLPPEARCTEGLDACALTVTRVEGSGAFGVLLQSPDTNGAADTLLLTAHDTCAVPPAAAAGTSWTAISMPCAPAAEMPFAASFVTVAPVAGPAHVTSPGAACSGPIDAVVPEGSALTVACSAEGDDLSGMSVQSDAPVVVVSGNAVTTVPVDPGAGLSGDLVMDLGAQPVGPALWAIPALPRSAAAAGRGDVVRIVALEDATVTVHDDRGATSTLDLAAGDVADLDTAGSGQDRALALDASASIAAWIVPKSRVHRGLGDPAGIPIVPSSRFTREGRFFVPDSYAEANVLLVAAQPGASLRLDGVPIALQPAPGVPLDMGSVALPAAPGGGAVHEIAGDAPFGAWVAGFGGYKAYGHAAASGDPPRGVALLRGTEPSDLRELVRVEGRAHEDADGSAALYWSVEEVGALLRVRRCGTSCCLQW